MGMYGNDPNQGQGRGIGTRLLIGIAIALVGWFMYMNQVEENPVTGKKQHVAISPDQEIKLGLESAPQMSREMGGEVPSSDPRGQVVQNLGNYLVQNTVAKKSPWQFKFHLLADDKTVNAFALPGGQIFITLGLLDKLENEAELAGVLGHEMGHVIERHTAEQMAKDQLGKTMVVAVGAAASDHGSSPLMIAAFVNQMIQLRYSRNDESEADEWGIKLMSEAGFNPRAMIQVMQVLKAVGGGGHQVEMFQTHPNPDLRMEQIEDYLKKNPPDPNLSDGHPLKYLYQHPEDVAPTSASS
jgi:predicted Zn-dependent protease